MSALEGLMIPRELHCPYYWGAMAKCPFGCWHEPSCQTDEPEHGWPIRDGKGRFITKDREREALAELHERAVR